MSDNELDSLFKEAAEGFKAPHDPSAWEAMAAMLDGATVATSFWNWKTISSLALVGVSSIALIVYLSVSDSNLDSATMQEVAVKQQAGLNQVVRKEIAKDQDVQETSENVTAKIGANNNPEAEKESSLIKVEFNKNKNGNSDNSRNINAKQLSVKDGSTTITHENLLSSESESKLNSVASKAAAKQSQSHNINQNSTTSVAESEGTNNKLTNNITHIAEISAIEKLADPKNTATISGETNSNQASINSTGSHSASEILPVQTDSVKKESEVVKEEVVKKDASENEIQKKEEEIMGFNRFAIKLTVSPDYSMVESATPNGLGINYGALFEYRINKHWSVATGGIWSKKIYSANDVEYSGYHADWVDGDCRMWDIPINVYYNFSSRKAFSFYASVGLSSYIMNEENYVYYIETPRGTYDYPKQIKGENNEWFKTLNISAGMQFRMSQQFSLQFEPTLKAPLAGVGEGEVSLVSLGAFLNLRYEIPFNKTRRNED